VRLFACWKSLPDRLLSQPANIFERILAKLANTALRTPLNVLKEQLYEGEAVKKRAMVNLINATMSG